jgi:hypothetical protein
MLLVGVAVGSRVTIPATTSLAIGNCRPGTAQDLVNDRDQDHGNECDAPVYRRIKFRK